MRRWLLWLLCLCVPAAVLAQDVPDEPGVFAIAPGDEVTETITDAAVFDWWQFDAVAGTTYIMEMTGQNGLAPLLGILDTQQMLLDRSVDGTPDDTVRLQWTATYDGQHTVVATRTGNQSGTTTGPYVLRLLAPESAVAAFDPFRQVTFVCDGGGGEVDTALTLLPNAAPADVSPRITAFGMGGFDPIVRVVDDGQGTGGTCATPNAEAPADLTLTLPDGTVLTGGAQVALPPNPMFGGYQLSVGTANQAPGRFAVVLEGFAVPRGGRWGMLLAQGPLARATTLDVYALQANSRLDALLDVFTDPTQTPMTCDDAGRRECADAPALAGLALAYADGTQLAAGRLDAALQLPPVDLAAPFQLVLSSSGGRGYGAAVLVIVGELPQRVITPTLVPTPTIAATPTA